jgi:hypothetical protein
MAKLRTNIRDARLSNSEAGVVRRSPTRDLRQCNVKCWRFVRATKGHAIWMDEAIRAHTPLAFLFPHPRSKL